MENKLERIIDELVSIKIEMAEVRKDLNYHIKRTDMLEDIVVPIKVHVEHVSFTFKALAWIASISGIVSVFNFIKKLL